MDVTKPSCSHGMGKIMTFMKKGHKVINTLIPLLSIANKNEKTILHSQPLGAPLHPVEQPLLSDCNQIMRGEYRDVL